MKVLLHSYFSDDDSKVFKDDLVNQEDSEIPCFDDENISGGDYNKITSGQFEDQTQETMRLESDVKVSKEIEDLRCTFCNKTYSFKTNLERHEEFMLLQNITYVILVGKHFTDLMD